MEAVRQAEAKLTVYVHPSNAADVRRAVARQLSTLLFSYVPLPTSLALLNALARACLSIASQLCVFGFWFEQKGVSLWGDRLRLILNSFSLIPQKQYSFSLGGEKSKIEKCILAVTLVVLPSSLKYQFSAL
jgi:hypothetical protein